jgi:hypothetical protein
VFVVLGKFFVTREHEVALCPLLVLGTYSFREGGGLVAAYVFDVFLYLLLHLAYARVLKTRGIEETPHLMEASCRR